jgi:hypothetical protein
MRSKTPLLVTLSLLACGPDMVVSPDEAGDEVATGESTSDSTSAESTGDSTDTSETIDCRDCLNPTVTQTDCMLELEPTLLGLPPLQKIPYIEIELDDTLVPYVDDCAREDGWTWLVEGEIVGLCGSWCLDPTGSFDVCYGCPPFGSPWPSCGSQSEPPDYCFPDG